MLEQADLSLALSKAAYAAVIPRQTERLYALQQLLFERKVPVIIVFEGWDAAGKGTSIRRLTQQLDPRGFKVLSTQAARTHELQKPWLWRFWMQIPRRGQMAIFDRSWYGRVTIERVEGLIPIPDWIRAYEEINSFEQTLTDDKTVLVKCWLHISKKEQLRRFMALSSQTETAWQVTVEDWDRHHKYDEYEAAVTDMLASTHTAWAPWEIVPSTDQRYRAFHIFRTIIARLEAALDEPLTDWGTLDEIEAAATRHQRNKQKKKQAKKKEKAQAKQREKKKQAKAAERTPLESDVQVAAVPAPVAPDAQHAPFAPSTGDHPDPNVSTGTGAHRVTNDEGALAQPPASQTTGNKEA